MSVAVREDLTQSVVRVWGGGFWSGSRQCGPQCLLYAPSWGQQKGAHDLGSRAEPGQAQPGVSSYHLQSHTLSESHGIPSRLKVLCPLVSGSPGPGNTATSGKAHLIVPMKREMAYWAASLNSFTDVSRWGAWDGAYLRKQSSAQSLYNSYWIPMQIACCLLLYTPSSQPPSHTPRHLSTHVLKLTVSHQSNSASRCLLLRGCRKTLNRS